MRKLLSLIVIVSLFSCKKNSNLSLAEKLNGKWELSVSSGGIDGKTITYAKGRVLEFNGSSFKEVENQKTIRSGSFHIDKGISILTKQEGDLILFENNSQRFFFTVDENKLGISHDAYDGMSFEYIRVE